MKLKILTPVLINNEYIMAGVHEIDEINADYIVKRGWARPVAKDESPNQIDLVEDLPLRLQDEIDDGALKGLIADPANVESLPALKKKKNK
jgi:hypothetical protein